MRWNLLALSLFVLLSSAGCTHRMPVLDLSQVEPSVLARCQERGALILEDERYEDYWSESYDNYKARLLDQMIDRTAAMTVPTPNRRFAFRIENEKGIEPMSRFSVVHYRELIPPVVARAWTAEGHLRAMNVQPMETRPLVDWPCRKGYPRLTTFRIGPLNVGDTIEVVYALSGPEQEFWRFGDPRFCVMKSKATFGHEHDTGATRVDMDTATFDRLGVVKRTSLDGDWPMVYEATRPIEPAPADSLPFVVRSSRCRGWDYLLARLFVTPIWLARDGALQAPGEILPKDLLKPAPANGKTARIAAVAHALSRLAQVDLPVSYWMRWLPREPAHRVLAQGAGSPGGLSTLAFRLLEEGGLAPRFALMHLRGDLPFVEAFAAPEQFDTLAVVVAGDDGRDWWLVPGIRFDPAQPVPEAIRGHPALVMERWVAERLTGGGSCWPEFELLFSCYNPSRKVESMKLIRP